MQTASYFVSYAPEASLVDGYVPDGHDDIPDDTHCYTSVPNDVPCSITVPDGHDISCYIKADDITLPPSEPNCQTPSDTVSASTAYSRIYAPYNCPHDGVPHVNSEATILAPANRKTCVHILTNHDTYSDPASCPGTEIKYPSPTFETNRVINNKYSQTALITVNSNGTPMTAYSAIYGPVVVANYITHAHVGVTPDAGQDNFAYLCFGQPLAAAPDYINIYRGITDVFTWDNPSPDGVTGIEVAGLLGELMVAYALNGAHSWDPQPQNMSINRILIEINHKLAKLPQPMHYDPPTLKLNEEPRIRDLEYFGDNQDAINKYRGDFEIESAHTLIEVKRINDLHAKLISIDKFLCTLYSYEQNHPGGEMGFGVFISINQLVAPLLVFGYKPALYINLHSISTTIRELIVHHKFKDTDRLVDEVINDLNSDRPDVRTHALNILHELYHMLQHPCENDMHPRVGNLLNPDDPRHCNNTDDRRQTIGLVGYSAEDITSIYHDVQLNVRFEVLTGISPSNRAKAYDRGIRLIIRKAGPNQGKQVWFYHNYDVSVLQIPLYENNEHKMVPKIDIELLMLINNCLWSSVTDIVYNLVTNRFRFRKTELYEYLSSTGADIDCQRVIYPATTTQEDNKIIDHIFNIAQTTQSLHHRVNDDIIPALLEQVTMVMKQVDPNAVTPIMTSSPFVDTYMESQITPVSEPVVVQHASQSMSIAPTIALTGEPVVMTPVVEQVVEQPVVEIIAAPATELVCEPVCVQPITLPIPDLTYGLPESQPDVVPVTEQSKPVPTDCDVCTALLFGMAIGAFVPSIIRACFS